MSQKLTAEISSLKAMLEECRLAQARLEGRISTLETLLASGQLRKFSQPSRPISLRSITTKQHAALQMLLRGASNAEIAARFGVTVNTAKVYVRGLFAKFGVRDRASLVDRAKELFESADASDYARWSGGLPKTWDSQWADPDPFAGKYRHNP